MKEILDLTRPVLVAECWNGGKQSRSSILIVGQPMFSPLAPNPSCFDRADDQVAHYASGNSLTPGDYPVGGPSRRPRWQQPAGTSVFHLVNLPTPRRQIAYSYDVKSDQAARLAKISRRTLERFLSEKTLLSDAELGLLGQLDAREVSRFASRYFLLVEDGVVDEDFNQEWSTSRSQLGSQSSRFGAICATGRQRHARSAPPGLVEAIRQKRFRSPTPLGPYRLQWLAAFSIAHRDPWPEVDVWLAENIDNQETVISDHAEAAEIGATAAGGCLPATGNGPRRLDFRPRSILSLPT